MHKSKIIKLIYNSFLIFEVVIEDLWSYHKPQEYKGKTFYFYAVNIAHNRCRI